MSGDDVREMILKSSPKSCELDPMRTSLLFECIDEVVPAVTHVVNESFLSGTFPSMFKTAIVKPLLKKSSLDQNDLKMIVQYPICPFFLKLLKNSFCLNSLKSI